MTPGPRISIIHRLPGRLRLRIDAISPDWKQMEKDLRGHPGIAIFQYSSVSHSLVVSYESMIIEEAEVVLRIGLSLSVSLELTPVILERETEVGGLGSEEFVVGSLLLILGLLRFHPLFRSRVQMLDLGAVLLSGGSVLAHAVGEMRRDGTFHPETLSVIYLAISAIQGKGYSAALLSWLASYGRHFRGRFIEELTIRAEPRSERRGRRKRYDLTLEPGNVRMAGNALSGYIPALIAHALAGGKPGDERFLSDFRNISESHGRMLEGLEGLADGITMHIK